MRLAVFLAAATWTLSMAVLSGLAVTPAGGAPPKAEAEELDWGLVRGLVTEIQKSDKEIQLILGSYPPKHRAMAIISAENFNLFSNVDRWQKQWVDLCGEMLDDGGRCRILLRKAKQLLAQRIPGGEKIEGGGVIRGVVAEILRSDKVIRVNLGDKSPHYRSAALVYPDRFVEFPNLEQWVGKSVEIRGKSLDTLDRPHVLLESRQQMVLLQTAPAAASEPVKTTGERATIRGLVAEVLKSDRLIRIHLGAKAPAHRFAAVIFPDNFEVFPDIQQLEGKTVEITGAVAEMGGRRQVILERPIQIVTLQGAAN